MPAPASIGNKIGNISGSKVAQKKTIAPQIGYGSESLTFTASRARASNFNYLTKTFLTQMYFNFKPALMQKWH